MVQIVTIIYPAKHCRCVFARMILRTQWVLAPTVVACQMKKPSRRVRLVLDYVVCNRLVNVLFHVRQDTPTVIQLLFTSR